MQNVTNSTGTSHPAAPCVAPMLRMFVVPMGIPARTVGDKSSASHDKSVHPDPIGFSRALQREWQQSPHAAEAAHLPMQNRPKISPSSSSLL
jgi:hypothetical protein